MANPYRELFNAPGSRGFVLAGMIARMPISMTGIGVITTLAQLKGGYGLAGAVAATFALATAFCAPQVSRLVATNPAPNSPRNSLTARWTPTPPDETSPPAKTANPQPPASPV